MGTLNRTGWAVAALLAVAIVASACGGSASGGSGSQGVALTGAGATFPDPIYEKWFKDFRSVEAGAKINYQAIGSGGGVTQYTAGTVDFGASDAPLKDEEVAAIKAKGHDVIEIPTVLGGVAIAYHVTGVDDGLKLDGATAANIFLGQIKSWNDPSIAALNPGATLPSTPIQVVHRSDESGTTKVFTSWLSKESSTWSSQVGADKAVQWPVGTGGDGNDGVAAGLSQTDGAIGYLSYDFAVTSGLGVAQIKRDTDGQFVAPSVQSITAAGGILKFPITADTNILNSSAAGAYPISTTTYLLVSPTW
ncbi:MAG TPA: phosphate ABC transporter substrate-binding protein PstS, partial [Actinomycetota bacterium]|nr:phosphate ABC transporter substrate-binding protein PstS [Actinomycetota bacterium]